MFMNGRLTILLAAVMGATSAQAAARFQSIYQFAGPPDGGEPYTGLTSAKGILYGTTVQGGTDGLGSVFSLTPPSAPGGAWTETVLYTFGGGDDGFNPVGNLAIDRRGAIYGTTSSGGRKHQGIVYELVPPAAPGGSWNKRTILDASISGLILDVAGNLYGTTPDGAYASGAVVELSRPAGGGAWSVTTLYNFTYNEFAGSTDGYQPVGRLWMDATGAIYGATFGGGSSTACNLGCGTVYQLTPPASAGGAWTESVLYSFSGGSDGAYPNGGVITDRNGVLYGATEGGGVVCVGTGCGVVYSLTPPAAAGGAWTEATVHAFSGSPDGVQPSSNELSMDSNGAIYGATAGGGANNNGAVFQLIPPATAGGGWAEHILWSKFTGGEHPWGDLVLHGRSIYGVTPAGGNKHCRRGCGTLFQLTR